MPTALAGGDTRGAGVEQRRHVHTLGSALRTVENRAKVDRETHLASQAVLRFGGAYWASKPSLRSNEAYQAAPLFGQECVALVYDPCGIPSSRKSLAHLTC
jgi:hypothetical protein